MRLMHLNHPIFKKLLVQVEEEYKFNNQGSLAIPCDELLFEEVLLVQVEEEYKFNNQGSLAIPCDELLFHDSSRVRTATN